MASDLFNEMQIDEKNFDKEGFSKALAEAKQNVPNPDAYINMILRARRIPQPVFNAIQAQAQQIQQMLGARK
jgi:hypothetical protein